jgi:hypothetical protein
MTKVITLVIFLLASYQSTFGQGIFEMWFMAGYTQHHACMVLDGKGGGVVRVKYYNAAQQRTDMVEETILVENTTIGVRLACYSPTLVSTSRATNYSADNFYIVVDEYGDESIYNLDDQKNQALVTVQEITTYSDINRILAEFFYDK